MLENFLIVIMALGCGVLLLGIVGWFKETIRHKSISKFEVNQLSIPKSKFIIMINDWCYANIKSNNPKPSISVSYYKHKKMAGVYFSSNNSIIVFVNNCPKLIDIVNVVCHEYNHSIQRTKGFDKLYNRYTQEKGYWDNPFERNCREIAERYQYHCLNDLLTNYQILG